MDAAARADMRIEVVKREINQGALAGKDSSITDYAARLIISALDSFDGLSAERDHEVHERLARIADWHARETGPGGMVGDFCTECGWRWPCDTRRMAEGTYVDEPA